MDHPSPQRLVVGISGASGAPYAKRLLQQLAGCDIDTHLVVSPLGQRLLHDELGMEGIDLDSLTAGRSDCVTLHACRDVGAALASGSFHHDGMIIIPCSSNTLSAIATGSAQHLMHRAAHVCLKERRKLVLVHREMPLSLIDIQNMAAVTQAGGILCPAQPGFYMLPQTIDDLVDFVVGRVLDLVGVPHDLNVRWASQQTPPQRF